MLLAGTVMDIPFSNEILGDESNFYYTVLFDNGTTASILAFKMASIISLPPLMLMCPTLNILFFLHFSVNIPNHVQTWRTISQMIPLQTWWGLLFCLHVACQQEDWSVPLPNLPLAWIEMCIKASSFPAKFVIISFVCQCLLSNQHLILLHPLVVHSISTRTVSYVVWCSCQFAPR